MSIKNINTGRLKAPELFYMAQPVTREYLEKYYTHLHNAGLMTNEELNNVIDSINDHDTLISIIPVEAE